MLKETTVADSDHYNQLQGALMPRHDSGYEACPTIMTEDELIRFLRIPEISKAKNYRHVIDNLKRMHGLPRVHLCGRTVYYTEAVKQWLEGHVTYGQ